MIKEAGLACELVRITGAERSSPEHLARHPLGRVPALELDDGTTMFESAAICLALADLAPDRGLIGPLGSSERALAYQWVLFAMTELEGPMYRSIRHSAGEISDAGAQERFEQAAAAIEAALTDREWLLGESFSVADVMCASVLGGAHSRGLLAPWPGLEAYVERAQARPAHIEAAAIFDVPRD
jgi:glutathione S-transferase